MNFRILSAFLSLLFFINSHAADKPNIVLMFIDDMGYGDIGPFGNKVNKTPNLDRMAAEGNVLRQFYVSNTACTPSRAALLTGSYAHRIGMDGMVTFPGENRGLNPEEITIAEVLKEQGYATGCFGKWHLGDQKAFLPLAQGFDDYFGIPYSNDMWPGNKRGNPVTDRSPYEPLPIIRGNDAVAYVADGADQSLLCEVVTDEAVKFIQAKKDEPFFCFIPHAYVHNPRFARPEILKRAEGDPDRANVEEVDDSVGRILDVLKELGIAENTLFIFTSDNGGAGGMSMGPLRGGKGGPKYEGHMRVPTVAWWPGKIEAGTETDAIAVTTDLLPTFAKLAGAEVPTDRTLDGKEVADIILGKPDAKSPHPIHYYEVEGVRKGKWKLVKGKKGSELYNLETDLGEKKNLAKNQPERLAELEGLLKAHVERVASDTRKAAFVENAKPILTEPGDLPKLRELVGKPETTAGNDGGMKGKIPPAKKANAADKPNVIVIITDDQGYGDLSAHGNPVLKTPNMDTFREGAVSFADFHVAPMCAPTRGQLMTGIDAMRNGCTAVCEGRSMMRAELPTMANFFAESGYATGHFGKWHLGDSYPHRPEDRGFQETIHHRAWGLTSLADHWENHTNVYYDPILSHNGVDKKFEGYCTDIFFNETMKWIEQQAADEKPFFVYLPTNTPHVPDIAPEKYLDPYRGEHEGKRMPTHFYGMIANLDENLGKLEAFLEDKKLKENTIVIYLSDNGTQSTAAKEIYNAGMREKKTSVYEGGHRVPLFVRWPNGKLAHGSDVEEMVQVQDLLPTLIELCDLESLDSPLEFDGTSLKTLLTGEKTELPDRKLVVQYRSSGEPWDPAVVMWNDWRLLRPKKGRNPQPPNAPLELYNVADDPGQKNNVLKQNGEVVAAMKKHYEAWYAEAKPLFDKRRWIKVGTEHSKSMILYAQDWVGGYCDNAGGLSQATAQGYWNVDIAEEGIYEIGLRRWPKESNKSLTEGWAKGPGGVARSARPIAAANLQIAGSNYTINTKKEDRGANFRVRLPAGQTQLSTTFMNQKGGALGSAIYVYLNRIDNQEAALTPTSDRKPSALVVPKGPSVAKPIPLKPRDVLIADFEGDTYGEWKTTGTAFGKGPTDTKDRIAGHQGKKLVDTFIISGMKDAPVGTLTSPAFLLERPYLNFLVGGGRQPGETGVALIVGGKRVQTATGNSFKTGEGKKGLNWISWDVSALKGKKAQVEIFDNRKIGWGHIVVDQIFLSGSPATDSPRVVGGKPLGKILKVDNTHLHIPVDNTANKQARLKLGIYDGEKLVQNFDVALPNGSAPDWIATYPLEHFNLKGKTISLRLQDPNRDSKGLQKAFESIKIGDDLPEEKAADFSAPYRNQFHAAARKGWLNDPNGMLYHDGKYHLYFQHNPFGIQWGNMHWYHVSSEDLVHWKHQPIAMFQKTTADMAFSGGGFVDFNNTAGLGKNTLFVAFTSTGRGECLAYSQDGGKTFTEIPENPIVEHKGRDPKIFWYEPEEKWVMVVYSEEPSPETEGGPEGKKKHFQFTFHESKDLRNWKRTGTFTDPDRDSVFECPDMFELEIGGQKKWVLYGAKTKYFIGEFDGKTFRKESGPFGGKADFWNTQHGHFYAAQNFSHAPDGRIIRVGWLKIQQDYTDKYPKQMTSQAMSLPHELQLRETSEGPRLASVPVEELKALRAGELDSLDDCKGELTEVLIEFEKAGRHELMINGIDASFEGKSARIFTDRTFNEVFAADGLFYKARHRKPEHIDSTETAVKGGNIQSLKVYRLKSIYR